MARHFLFQQPPSPPLVLQCDREMASEQAQPRVLYTHPYRPDVLIEMTPDGPDFTTICERHQFQSAPVQCQHDLRPCPECAAELEAAPGKRRYAALHRANVRITTVV